MSSAIRVAIIGAGYWGANLLRTFHATEGFTLSTVCDARRESLQAVRDRYPHTALETSYQAVLQDPTIEAVAVATPPASHFSIALAALTAGKHVWVEKPLALRYTEGRQLVDAARKFRRSLFVDETFLYDSLVERLRSQIAAGDIGAPYHVSLERTGMGRIRRDSNVWWNSAPHDVSVLRYILNSEVRQIAATGHAFLQPGIEDVVWASLRMVNGVSAHIYLHWLFPDKKASLMVVGERGMLRYEGRFEQRAFTRYEYRLGAAATRDAAQANVIPIERCEVVEEVTGERPEPLARACLAFRDSILTGAPAPSCGDQALRTLAVLEAGAQSLAQGGAWIDIAAGAGEKGIR
jgi:predicted dehydrogenase